MIIFNFLHWFEATQLQPSTVRANLRLYRLFMIDFSLLPKSNSVELLVYLNLQNISTLLIREHILSRTFSSTHCNYWRYYESLIQDNFCRLMTIQFASNLYETHSNLAIETNYFSICFLSKTKSFQLDWNMKNSQEEIREWLLMILRILKQY
jgi:hypothetical protein